MMGFARCWNSVRPPLPMKAGDMEKRLLRWIGMNETAGKTE